MVQKMVLGGIIVLIGLTGCSGLKNIQDLTYIVTIGMDYDEENEEFTVYLQGLNFANVAKQEGAKPVEPVPIFVGSAKGETLNLAVRKLYKKSEPPLFFGHVETFVLSEEIVKHKFHEVITELGRNRSIRHTLRVFMTEDNIEDVLNVKALFEYPAIYTVLFMKKNGELQDHELKPVHLMDFLRQYYEPMGTAKLPSVKVDTKSWKAEEAYPVLYLNKLAVFQQQKYVKSLPFEQALFLEWLLQEQISVDQKVMMEDELVAALKLKTPKMKITYEKNKDSPIFSIVIDVQADLLEMIKSKPIEELTKKVGEDLTKQFTEIYEEGLQNELDLFNLGEKWYRTHPKKYKKLKEEQNFYLTDESLKDIKVNVELFHFNSYEYDRNHGF
jgi:Ger(x)C family germination protein